MMDVGKIELKDLHSSEHDRSQNFLSTCICQSFKDSSEGVIGKFRQRDVFSKQEFHVFVGKEFPEPKQRTPSRERIQNHGQHHASGADFHIAIAQSVDTLNEPYPLCIGRNNGQEPYIGNLKVCALLLHGNLLQKVPQVLSQKASLYKSQPTDIISGQKSKSPQSNAHCCRTRVSSLRS